MHFLPEILKIMLLYVWKIIIDINRYDCLFATYTVLNLCTVKNDLFSIQYLCIINNIFLSLTDS